MKNDDRKRDIGLVYVAFGYEYLLMAAHSAYSAKFTNYNISCTLVTNLVIEDPASINDYFDEIHQVDRDNEKNRDIKTRAIDYVTYEKGAYIDCDTEVRGDLSPMFKCLDRFEIILKLNAYSTSKDYLIDDGIRGHEFPVWNSGVVFFKNRDGGKRFFSEWNRLFHEFGKSSDQPALACAVYENPDIRYLSVNCAWNTFPSDVPLLKHKGFTTKSRIWHYRDARRFRDLASKIIEHHDRLCATVGCRTNEDSEEVVNVYRKYRFLSAWYHRNIVTGYIAKKLLKILKRFGLFEDEWLRRYRYGEGTQFDNLRHKQPRREN